MDHTNCPKMLYKMFVDPIDTISRTLVCPHGVMFDEQPKQIMIVWPDGKTSVWPEN